MTAKERAALEAAASQAGDVAPVFDFAVPAVPATLG